MKFLRAWLVGMSMISEGVRRKSNPKTHLQKTRVGNPAEWHFGAMLREQHSMQQKVNILIRQMTQIGLPRLL